MKISCLLTALLASLAMGNAAEPTAHLYKGEIAGIACAACSKKVKSSLEKLPGVTSIKVVPGGESGVAKLEISSTSPDITKDTAIKALGKAADEYTILKLEVAKEK